MQEIYINTIGTYLHIKDKMFELRVKNRETKEVIKKTVAAHKVKSIIFTVNAAMSTEAIGLALKNNIDVVMLDGLGKPLGRFWHSKLGSTTVIRKQQLKASLNNTAVLWIKKWLCQKIENQAQFLKDLKKHRAEKYGDFLADKIERITNLKTSVEKIEANTVDDIAETLRGLEGTAGRLYFETLSHLLAKTYPFKGRSMRPAKDSFNAFLNYAYGILYSKVEKALIIAGIDPYIGFMHRDDYNYKSMLYDFIEPYRIYADTVVFRLFSAKKVNKAHTDEITNGFSLNKEGKELLVNHFLKYLEEDKIKHNRRLLTRFHALQLNAHRFANELLGQDNEVIDNTTSDDILEKPKP